MSCAVVFAGSILIVLAMLFAIAALLRHEARPHPAPHHVPSTRSY